VASDSSQGAEKAAPYENLNPTPYPGTRDNNFLDGMPKFDLEKVTPLSNSAWIVQSVYDSSTAPASSNLILGDETACRYDSQTVPVPVWTASGDDPNIDVNNDIVEFRVKATDGLPAGRYYLTVNVMDPIAGAMSVDNINELEYSIKYYHSDPNGVYPAANRTISADIAYILSIPVTPAEIADRNRLLRDYFATYWQSVDSLEFIATKERLAAGSGAPEGWVFTPAREPGVPLVETAYPTLVTLLGADSLQALFDIPRPAVTPPPPPFAADTPYRWSQSYFRDGVMPPNLLLSAYGADQPVGTRTLTVIVPPADDTTTPTQTYDTLCIAFRLKPMEQNIDPATGLPRKLAINFLDFSQQPDHEYVELANTTDKAINLKGWTLEVGIPDPAGFDDDRTTRDPFKSRWTVPEGTVIAPKGYLLLGFDAVDHFQAAPTADDNLITRNGMGLESGSANPLLNYVTSPPIGGSTTGTLYDMLSDPTASVFKRNTATDYIDNDGDGVSSAPFVYGYGTGPSYDYDLSKDTDHVATEAKYHGDANGVVPPFARIVQMECSELWWESPTAGTTPYVWNAEQKKLSDINTTERVAELVLRGGILPDYPEHDGHDNDGDGGFVFKDPKTYEGSTGNPLLRYARGTLDKDMVDNNLNGYIDECGMEQLVPNGLNLLPQNGNPLASEGVDEGRFVNPVWPLSGKGRPRIYGYGSYEEGDLPLFYTAVVGNNDSSKGDVGGYRFWVSELQAMELRNYTWQGVVLTPEKGYPYTLNDFTTVGSIHGLDGTGNAANYQYWTLPLPGGTVYAPANPVVRSEPQPLSGQPTSPEWKAFCERRWNPGDCVIVTLYVGPSSERKVADRVTYREQDVINRAVDDIQDSPYFIDGYRNFTGTVWGGADGITANGRVCLDANRPQYWLPNQMGLDFYRSLERKHPLYAGDKFGTSNRWEATDGNYDDWSDSLSVFEAVEDRSRAYEPPSSNNRSGLVRSRFFSDFPLQERRLFGHAMAGSPLRMNTQQRLWDNPPDLVALLSSPPIMLADSEGLTTGAPSLASLDGKKLRQFIESDQIKTSPSQTVWTENRAYTLREAEVRNRPYNSIGDLLSLPLLGFNVPLDTGIPLLDPSGLTDYVSRSTNASINTRWLPTASVPVANTLLQYWRQDTTVSRAVLGGAPDTLPSFLGTLPADAPSESAFAAVTELTDIDPVVLTVGQAKFRPIWPNPTDSRCPSAFSGDDLHWLVNGTTVLRAPHCWAPVMLLAGYPTDTPNWATLPRWTVAYAPPLPIGQVAGGAVTWPSLYQWTALVSGALYPMDAPYLVQTEFLRDDYAQHKYPVFGAMSVADVDSRWPKMRLFPPTAGVTVPLENVEYPRAVMFVSQHDDTLGETGRAEGIFSWDADDGLENGTYIAYVATFVPRMGKSLKDSDSQVVDRIANGVTGANGLTAFNTSLLPHQAAPPTAPALNNVDPITEKICDLDPGLPHADGTDRFDPVLALEFVTDPAVVDRVRPAVGTSGYNPDPARPLAALPHPADWYPNTIITNPNGVQNDPVSTAAAYRADGDGLILYSGSSQVTWRARLVRVTDRFLALRVRNMGDANQVACISAVILAPAGRVAGKININTAETRRVIRGETGESNYYFSLFNTLLGLPGVVDVLANTRDPKAPATALGQPVLAESDLGWPEAGKAQGSVPDPKRQSWPKAVSYTVAAPDLSLGVQMPPGVRVAVNDTDQLAEKNTGSLWDSLIDGKAALRMSSLIMAGRTEYEDGRYYKNFGDLARGAGKGGTLKKTDYTCPLSNESVPERRFEEIDSRLGRMANLITGRSDVFEILVNVQAGNTTDTNGDNRIDYRSSAEFSVTAESQGRVIYERRARVDRSDEATTK